MLSASERTSGLGHPSRRFTPWSIVRAGRASVNVSRRHILRRLDGKRTSHYRYERKKGARRMHGEEQAIDHYMAQVAHHLDLPAAEREATLLEIRSHLEELAAARMAAGAHEAEAQRQALAAFGDARRVGRTLSSGRLIQWGRQRWVVGVITGALLTWVIWTAGTFLVQEYYFTVNPVIILGSPALSF